MNSNNNTRQSIEALGDVLDDLAILRETILAAVIPEVAQRHFRSSHREALLALRAVLDRSIERLGEQASPDSPPAKTYSRSIHITE